MTFLFPAACGVNSSQTISPEKRGRTPFFHFRPAARTCQDAAGQAVSVSRVDGANSVQQAYAASGVYGPDGALESVRIGAVNETRGYTASRRLQEIRATAATGTPAELWKLSNFYCQTSQTGECAASNGNVYFQKVTAGALTFDTSFTYDARNRLLTAAEAPVGGGAGWSQQYSYDVFGNRWMTGSAPGGNGTPSTEASIDAGTNRLVGYGYDAAGHQIAAGARFMEWDGEGRMVREGVVVNGTETASRYYYDGEGRRVRRVAAGGAGVDYVYDALGRLAMEQGAGVTPGCRTGCYVTADHLGSTRMLPDQTGALIGRFDYMPFGEAIVAGQSFSNGRPSAEYGDSGFVAQKFTSKERDAETGLDYFGARYMSAAQGRFTSADAPLIDQSPRDPQSWNLYSYGRNNPLRYVDPTGNYVCASSVTTEQCDSFQQSLDQSQTAANALKNKYGADSKQYTDAQGAISAYGQRGKDNGVTIAIGDTGGYAALTTVANVAGPITDDNNNGQKITVTFNDKTIGNTPLAAHEGSHVADASAYVRSGFNQSLNPKNRQTETTAYQVQSNIGIGLGWEYQTVTFGGHAPYLLNVRGWSQANTDNVINAILNQQYRNLDRRAFPLPAPGRRR